MTPIALQERSCHLKRRYFTEIDALVMAGKRQIYGAPKLRAYQCRFCGGWHLTKQPPKITVDDFDTSANTQGA